MNVLGQDFSEGPLGHLESQEGWGGKKSRKRHGFMILCVETAVISGPFGEPSLQESCIVSLTALSPGHTWFGGMWPLFATLSPCQGTHLTPAGPILRFSCLWKCRIWELVLVLRGKIKKIFSHFRLLSLKNGEKKHQTQKHPPKKILQKTSKEGRDLTSVPEVFFFCFCMFNFY